MKLQTMPLRFRVWDDVDKKFLLHWAALSAFTQIMNPYDRDSYIISADGGLANLERYSVSQDTGLKDRNGMSIWTGDIVETTLASKCNGYHSIFKGWFAVQFDKDKGQLFLHKKADIATRNFNLGLGRARKCKVVGNIWQNPELLEG